jgi:hypothetical protein
MASSRRILSIIMVATVVLGTSSANASEPQQVVIVATDERDRVAALETLGRWSAAVPLTVSYGQTCDPVTGAIVVCFSPDTYPVYSTIDDGGVAYVTPTSNLNNRRKHLRQGCRDARRPRKCLRREVRLFITEPIQHVICHEVGHGLGLGHNERPTSCMGYGWTPDAIDLSEAVTLH